MKSKTITLNTQEGHFKSISEITLENWIKCVDGDLRFSRKNVDLNSELTESDVLAWNEIYDTYIAFFGLGDVYKKILSIMKKKALLELEFINKRVAFKLTEITIQEAKLKQLLENKGSSMTIKQSLIHLSRWMGQMLKTKEITVEEYFNLIEEYGKHNQKK